MFSLLNLYPVLLLNFIYRCFFVNNCKSPATWKSTAVSDKSFADGKWHKFGMYMTREMEDSSIQCQVDGSLSQKVKFNGVLVNNNDGILYLAGLPDANHQPKLNESSTCFPKAVNFSGCIADLQINFATLSGYTGRVNITHLKLFGDVSARCTEAKHYTVSFSDKNSKILLAMKDTNRFNTSFEFQIRTRETRAFVGKIISRIVTALFFLEMGSMKVSVRFEDLNGHKGESFYLTSSGISLSDNNWHKVTFHVAKETGAYLFINDALRGKYQMRKKISHKSGENGHEPSYVTLRFGRSARKYPSFIGCLRDVYVNNHPVNFSQHDSKGISVGECEDSFINDRPNFKEDKNKNTTVLRTTEDPFPKGKSFDGRTLEATKNSSVTSTVSSNEIGDTITAVTPYVKQQLKNDSNFNKTFPIAVALTVGLLIMIFVLVYVLGVGLKSRIQNCCRKPITEEKGETEPSTMRKAEDKDGYLFQPADRFKNLSGPGHDQGSHTQDNLYTPTANRHGGRTEENYRSARRLDESPVKVWEERYLSQAASTAVDSNFLTIPKSYYTQMQITRSQEKLSSNIDNVGHTINITPQLDECVTLQKYNHGVNRQPSDSINDCKREGRRPLTDANPPQSPKWLNRAYACHALPKHKKASSLSWAYGKRFVRNESSDTDCSDVDRVTRIRPRNQVMESGRLIKPWQLKFLESSEDELERKRAKNGNHAYGRSRKLRTFTDETYKLYSLQEEEREVDSIQRRLFTADRLKVYIPGRNRSTSFAEAPEHCDDTVGIGCQVRALDGYTSSCPESIQCLSEKEDRSRNIHHAKRLTTHYF